jgi:hypothetical protein
MSIPFYLIGAGVVATGRFVPVLLELGVWSVGQLMYGMYWVAWGRNEPQRQTERLRLVIREELREELKRMQNNTGNPNEDFLDVMSHSIADHPDGGRRLLALTN